jgi:predicted nucleotidyltransferase
MQRPSDIGLELVRRRRALGISQRELGERVGVKQPQVARWEAHAYRAASLERVDAVAVALGPQGETVPIAAEEPAAYGTATAVRPVRDLGEIAARLRGHSEKLRELEFVDIAVFGSFARGEQTRDSDVDVLVEMRVIEGFRYIQAANRVEDILGRKTDVARAELLRDRLRDRVLREAIHVWRA